MQQAANKLMQSSINSMMAHADDFISCSTDLSGSSISRRYCASAASMTAIPSKKRK
jgi:hypothetical protein